MINNDSSSMNDGKMMFADAENDLDVPFVHRFETGRHKYLFDANTMHIIRVDPVLWAIVYDADTMGRAELVRKYSSQFSTEAIGAAHDAIIRARREGHFLSWRPRQAYFWDERELQHGLNHMREQLILTVTENCNLRCRYCVYCHRHDDSHTRYGRQMTWSTAQKAIDAFLEQTRETDIHRVSFYGGEPLLNLPLIEECVLYIRRANLDVTFGTTTNGTLLEGKAADFLARNSFQIMVSLDGPERIHDRYRRDPKGNASWDIIVANVKAFLQKYPDYQCRKEETGDVYKWPWLARPGRRFLRYNAVLAPPLDLGELDRFFASHELFSQGLALSATLVGECPARHLLRGNVVGFNALKKKFLKNLLQENFGQCLFSPEYALQRDIFEINWLKFHKRFARYGKYPTAPGGADGSPSSQCLFCHTSTCIPGIRRTYVTVDGNYFPCERVPESDYMKIGDVNEGISISKVQRLLREWVELNAEECDRCWLKRICQVGCWSETCDGTKPTVNLRKAACAHHRRRMHEFLIDYCAVLEQNPHALDYMKNIRLR